MSAPAAESPVFTETRTGLLIPHPQESESVSEATYLPANHHLETIPHGLVPVPAAESEPEPVGAINQEEPSTEESRSERLGWFRRGRRPRRNHHPEGLTRKVRRTRAGSAEAAELAGIESRRVIEQRVANREAAQLEQLAEDPHAEARSNRRSRKLFLSMAFAGIALGVGISSTTAQQTITAVMGWAEGSAAAVAAYGADPALGLVLFAVLGVRALAASRGVGLPQRVTGAFNKIEFALFSLVALLNVGPTLSALAGHLLGGLGGLLGLGDLALLGQVPVDVLRLAIHSLGPVLVATGVWGIPYILSVFSEITAATNAKRRTAETEDPTGDGDLARRRAGIPQRFHADFDRVAGAIESGELPADPTGGQILRHLGGDAAKKAPLREALAGYRPGHQQ